MGPLIVYENDPISIGEGGLTPAEAEQLLLVAQRRPGLCTRKHHGVQLAQYCGLLNLGGRMLEILPKLTDEGDAGKSVGLVLRLLSYARDFPLFQHLSAGHGLRPHRLLDVFISAFLDTVSTIVHGGLLRQYREHEDDLRVVRGQITFGRQLGALFNRPDVIACRFDDLTADNTWNQIVKAGLRAVAPWISSVDLNRRWVELMSAFSEVDDVSFDRTIWNRLIWDRHAVRYRAAVEWVRWILSLLSPSLHADDQQAPGLLFDMNALFQSAVTAILRRAAPATGLTVHGKGRSRHLASIVDTDRHAFTLKPDLILERGDELLAIGDAKWKQLEVKGRFLVPSPGDIYQMNAYASAYGCSELALIYPWYSGLKNSTETAFELPPLPCGAPRITVIVVDLSCDPPRTVQESTSPFVSLLK